jgi:hypothetical protein
MSCIENFNKIEREKDGEYLYGIVFFDDYDFHGEYPLRYEWYDSEDERDYTYKQYCDDI